MTRPRIGVFDVNETLSDMTSLAASFAEVGARELTARVWFASLLRDGFALTAAGTMERFAKLGSGALRTVLAGEPLTRDLDAAVEHIMRAFLTLRVHPDVPSGVRALRQGGLRLVTLSNGSAEVAERLLSTAGIRSEFEQLLSVEDAGVWKPAPGAYAYASRVCGVLPEEMLLIAAHPWDIDGAARAGMATAWLNRSGAIYPDYFIAPDHSVPLLPELARSLGNG